MKPRKISVTITEAINCGNFEVLHPSVMLEADLEADDDIDECAKELHAMASKQWARNALVELSWVQKRREDPDKKHEFRQLTDATKVQLKDLVTK